MRHPRLRASFALTALATSIVAVSAPTPTFAEPDIEDVQARVDRLYTEAEAAQERYHDAKIDLDEVSKELTALRKDQRRQEKVLETARVQVEDSIVSQYEGMGISAVGQVAVSEDPKAFLSKLTTVSAFNDMQAAEYSDFQTQLEALDIRRAETQSRLTEAQALEEKLEDEKDEVDTKFNEAQDLLDELEAEERERLAEVSRSDVEAPAPEAPAVPEVPASGGAGAAISFAMAQIGDSYVYGAAGPDAWDCSGLMMVAWAQAGVGLPHSSSAQMGSGASVSISSLQPGDLVFYYSPVSHVGMYIGNGQIVHAANPGTGVVTAPLDSMPISGAVRPG